MRKQLLSGFVLWALLALVWTDVQAQNLRDYKLSIKKSPEPITLDGKLQETAWQNADLAQNFFQTFPYDTSFSRSLTEVRVTYDEQNLYIGAICFDPEPGNYTIQSLKRDFSYPVSDAFAVYIDPFNDKTNGFSFAVNPLGVQREGLVQNGGSFGVTTAWDNKWLVEVAEYEDRWVAEIAIPFKTLRYKKGSDLWRINFSRNNLKANENSAWVPVPLNYNIATLAFTGELVWDAPPPKTGTNVALIPYVAGGIISDYQAKETETRLNAGGDAKIVVTPSLNLDITINPDFSQVEVDRQVTNLDRFELFFPERRQFFIENSDLFANFGFSRIRPFFSRRIGLNSGVQVPILAGARLSGKLDENWRIGVMNMQTEGVGEIDLEGQNYTVAAVQRQVFARSNIGGILVNRFGFRGNQLKGKDRNTTAGLDYNIYSADNKWRGKVFYHHNFSVDSVKNNPDGSQEYAYKNGPAQAVWLMYQDNAMTVMYNHEYVSRTYDAEVGFVPRRGYFRLEPMAWFRFFPKKNTVINNHGPEIYLSQYWNEGDFRLLENQFRLGYQFSFQNRTNINFQAEDWYLWLQREFDPARVGGNPLPDSTGYRYRFARMNYSSDFRKKLNYSASVGYGSYFNGTRFNVGGELNFRAQPWGVFSLSVDHNRIALPDSFSTASLTLISPRFDLSFTKNVFFTTFLQYNTQTENFNINARLQWRFKPMSDLFIVLTENYGTENLNVKNRAIVFKLNYWIQI